MIGVRAGEMLILFHIHRFFTWYYEDGRIL